MPNYKESGLSPLVCVCWCVLYTCAQIHTSTLSLLVPLTTRRVERNSSTLCNGHRHVKTVNTSISGTTSLKYHQRKSITHIHTLMTHCVRYSTSLYTVLHKSHKFEFASHLIPVQLQNINTMTNTCIFLSLHFNSGHYSL